VAQVVLENIYKSFSGRPGQAADSPDNATDPSVNRSGNRNPKLTTVLRAINLTIQDGEFMVLVGPSGCGKSTLLRLIAGLETATAGNIWVGDRCVNELPPKARDIAMVFQNYALYPHLSVYDNLAFGLRRSTFAQMAASKRPNWIESGLTIMTKPLPKGWRYVSGRERSIRQHVMTVAQMLQIEPLLDRLPKQLSGGQKQRVALGRAMARSPQVFLMDEPLSNLDAKLRTETRSQIVKLQHQLGTTTIYVTHDQTEAMTMGDRIAVLNAGQIQQIATPLDLYNAPANRFVAEFIGSPPMNFLSVQVQSPTHLHHPSFTLTLPEVWSDLLKPYVGQGLLLGIRPEHLSQAQPATNTLPVEVELVEALGHETFLSARMVNPDTLVQVRLAPDRSVQRGDRLSLSLDLSKIHLFDPQSELRIVPRSGELRSQ
jgi:multiple sugar transport system ATP-binding protein